MKPKKDNSRSIGPVIILGAAFLIILTVFLIGQKGGPVDQGNNTNIYNDNVSGILANASIDCPYSDSGIPLCELTPAERHNEELKDQLNRELAGMQNAADDTDLYAPVKKPSPAVVIYATSSVRLMVAIPGSDHASLVAEDLKNVEGITDVYWSPPNLYDIKYDPSMTSVDKILSRDIFKKYNASVVSPKKL